MASYENMGFTGNPSSSEGAKH